MSCKRIRARGVPVLVLVGVLGLAADAGAQTTAVFMDSQLGDPIGDGMAHTLTPPAASFFISSFDNSIRMTVDTGSFSDWQFEFSSRSPLAPGTYETARRAFTGAPSGLEVTAPSEFCSTVTGRFVIHEVVYGPGSSVISFAADFEQHCNDAEPGLYGSVRYNSAISSLTPFGGNYPLYRLTLTAPVNGEVLGDGGIDCGTNPLCVATYPFAQMTRLVALPHVGYVFAGWTGDCRGDSTIALHVNGPKGCAAAFELETPVAPRTLFMIDSEPGDSAGLGIDQFYSPLNSTIQVLSQNSGNTLQTTIGSVTDTSYVTWQIDLSAPIGQQLQAGTTYYGLLPFVSGRPRASVRGVGSGCFSTTGRFAVLELVRDGSGNVLQAAVDAELHCDNANPAIFIAIRFNSALPQVPFDGDYPDYHLSVMSPAGGTITDGVVNCGTLGTTCERDFDRPTDVTVTAVPDAGYLFAGWTGDCTGGATPIVLRVNGQKSCSADFQLVIAIAPRTVLVTDLRPVSGPATLSGFSTASSRWTVTQAGGLSGPNQISVRLETPTLAGSNFSFLDFAAPRGQVLQVGVQYAATSFFDGATPSMRTGGSCSGLLGRFVVLEFALATAAQVERLAIDFEQHCTSPDRVIYGAIRFNSTYADGRPFQGNYPRYSLAFTAPVNGRVVGAGINCGGGGTDCQVLLGTPSVFNVTGVPDPGFMFTGWTGACHGGAANGVNVRTVYECGALFDPIVAPAPRTLLRLDSQPGEPSLAGMDEVYSLGNSLWSASTFTNNGNRVSLTVNGRVESGEAAWQLIFAAPTGQKLQVGTYSNASSSSSGGQPQIEVRGANSCFALASTFTVREVVFNSVNAVVRFAADFEVHCNAASAPALFGSVQFNSTIDQVSLTANPKKVAFGAVHAGGGSFSAGASESMLARPTDPTWILSGPQRITLTQRGAATVTWSVAVNAPWLSVSPVSGTGPATLVVTVNPALASIGTNNATISFAVTGATAVPDPINVTLSVSAAASQPPVGAFETPVTGAVLTGPTPVVGWALDDVQVISLQIWRDAHPYEGSDVPTMATYPDARQLPGRRIFVGYALQLEGARPDVEAAINLPHNTRAGWGFTLDTAGLIWNGQGPFRLYAIAVDAEGKFIDLGAKLVSIGNTVTQAPLARNLRVAIDGILQDDLYVTAADVAAGRPTRVDATDLADGAHTIQWLGVGTGGSFVPLGTRYFRVAGGRALPFGQRFGQVAFPTEGEPAPSRSAVDAAFPTDTPPSARIGWTDEAPAMLGRAADGPFETRGHELDRFEVQVAAATGYLRVGDELRTLPIGSVLDPATGTFTWQPGAGFVGSYEFVFLSGQGGTTARRTDLRIVIEPKRHRGR